MAQLSSDPEFMSNGDILALPMESNWIIISWQLASGGILSWTVTIPVQEEVLLFTSITVNVTVLSPTCEQSNSVWSKYMVSIPQASFEPLLMSFADMIGFPTEFNWIVISWQLATGGMLSSTVTSAWQVELLPLISNTVSVTVFAPIFEQSNVVWSSVKL